MTLSLLVSIACWLVTAFSLCSVLGSLLGRSLIKQHLSGIYGGYQFVSDDPRDAIFVLKTYASATGLIDALHKSTSNLGNGYGALKPNRILRRELLRLRGFELAIVPWCVCVLATFYRHDNLAWTIFACTVLFNLLDNFWVTVSVYNTDLLLEVDGTEVRENDNDFNDPGFR